MRQVRKLTALTRAGIIESLQFRLGTFVTLFANLIYLALESLACASYALGRIGLEGLVDSECEGLLLTHLHFLNSVLKLNGRAVSAHACCGIVVIKRCRVK